MTLNTRSWAALILGLLTLFVTSCGDSNGIDDISGQQGNPGGPNLTFPGAYLGANNLDPGQTAVLDLDVATNGQATGFLNVRDTVAAQTIDINPADYPISGSVNLTTGTFNLTGSFPGLGAFTILGTLPVGNNLGTYVLTVNGRTFNGNIQNANLGVPNPPGGGGGGGNQRLILGGEVLDFTFTPDGSYNGVEPPVDATSLIGGAVVTGSATQNLVTISLSEIEGSAVRGLVFGIVTQDGEALVVGETYPLVATNTETGSVLSLSESVGTTVTEAWVATTGTSAGSVTLVALDDNGVEVDFNFTNVIPNSAVANNTAAGTFDISGTVVADFAPTLP